MRDKGILEEKTCRHFKIMKIKTAPTNAFFMNKMNKTLKTSYK
jgi:hypothetical protein